MVGIKLLMSGEVEMFFENHEAIFPKQVPVLSTNRLDLIEITDDHIQDIFQIYSNDNVTKYDDCYSFTSLDHAADAVNLFKQVFKNKTGIRWAITFKNEKKLIGNIGFNQFQSFHTGKIGFALNEQFWGMGICTEAIREVVRYGFDTLKIHRIEAETHPENTGSGLVLTKNGFKREGTLRDFVFWKGVHQTIVMYSKISGDK
jgi:RimJ/RimL family protein N-acetyltransferase